jgi:hypothetical protein
VNEGSGPVHFRGRAVAQELKVIQDCYDLTLYLSGRVEKFPRSHRYTLGAEIERRLLDVLGGLIRAKYSPVDVRVGLLADVNAELEVLRFQVRLSKDLKALPVNSYGHAAGLLEGVGGQVGGWLKASRAKGGTP